jgi:hypothetical protein
MHENPGKNRMGAQRRNLIIRSENSPPRSAATFRVSRISAGLPQDFIPGAYTKNGGAASLGILDHEEAAPLPSVP